MAQSDHDLTVQPLDSQTTDTPKTSADSAPRNVQAERPVSVPASLLSRPAPRHCKTCGAACTDAQWLVPEFLGGGWACKREHVQ